MECGERDGQTRLDWTDLDICASFKDGISADHDGQMCAMRCTASVREENVCVVEKRRKKVGVLWLKRGFGAKTRRPEREGWQTSLTAFSS